jgi:hypothetical protein
VAAKECLNENLRVISSEAKNLLVINKLRFLNLYPVIDMTLSVQTLNTCRLSSFYAQKLDKRLQNQKKPSFFKKLDF